MKKNLIALALVATCMASAQAAPLLRVGDVVEFSNATIACQTRDGLRKAVAAASRETAENKEIIQGLFGTQNGQGQCIMLDPRTRARVLSVEYNEPRAPDIGIVEIAGEESAAPKGQGAWALTLGASKVQ